MDSIEGDDKEKNRTPTVKPNRMSRRFEFERPIADHKGDQALNVVVRCCLAKGSSDLVVEDAVRSLASDLTNLGLLEGRDYEWIGFSMVKLKNDVAVTGLLLASERPSMDL